MMLRIKRMAEPWVSAIRSLAGKQNLAKRKRKKVGLPHKHTQTRSTHTHTHPDTPSQILKEKNSLDHSQCNTLVCEKQRHGKSIVSHRGGGGGWGGGGYTWPPMINNVGCGLHRSQGR